MPRVREDAAPRRRVDPREDERREEAPRVRRAQDAVHLDEDLRRAPPRLDERQEAGLHHRPLDAARVAVPGDVARGDPERPLLVDEELVEVAARLGREDRPRRDLEPRHVGRVIGQERHLHPREEVHLVLHAPLALDPLDEVGRVEARLVLALGPPAGRDPDPRERDESAARRGGAARGARRGSGGRRGGRAGARAPSRRRGGRSGRGVRKARRRSAASARVRTSSGAPRRVLERAGVEERVADRAEDVGPLAREDEAEERGDEDEGRRRVRPLEEGVRDAPEERQDVRRRLRVDARDSRRRDARGEEEPEAGDGRAEPETAEDRPAEPRARGGPTASASRLVVKPGTVSRSIDSATTQ